MVSDLFFYQLVLIALVWLCVMLHWVVAKRRRTVCPTTPTPPPPKRNREPKPFAGLTTSRPATPVSTPARPAPKPP